MLLSSLGAYFLLMAHEKNSFSSFFFNLSPSVLLCLYLSSLSECKFIVLVNGSGDIEWFYEILD